ncbi:hypothetical protein ROHU_016236 [Labeo rohita]|nr:hypothetical protein ROHU_016236 [Labeo rohita]
MDTMFGPFRVFRENGMNLLILMGEVHCKNVESGSSLLRVQTLGGSDPVMSNSHSALAKCHDGKDGWSLGRLAGSDLLRMDTAPVSALIALPESQWKGPDIREGLIGFRISSLR